MEAPRPPALRAGIAWGVCLPSSSTLSGDPLPMAVRVTLRCIMAIIELVLLAPKGGLPMPRHTMLAVLLTAVLIASAVRVAPGEESAPPVTSGSQAVPAAWVDDLTPLSPSEWNADRAAHLLERAGFGGTPEEIARL